MRQLIAQLGSGIDRAITDLPTTSRLKILFEEHGFKEMGTVVSHETDRCILAMDMRCNARALLMNANKELLLMKVKDDITVDPLRMDNHFWVTIGGGIEKGEEIVKTL